MISMPARSIDVNFDDDDDDHNNNNSNSNSNNNKYADLPTSYLFQPIALEMLGPINESATHFIVDLDHRISANSNEECEGAFLFQRLSVLLQHFNAVLLRNSFATSNTPDLWLFQ